MNKQRIPAGKVPPITYGIEDFDLLETAFEAMMVDIVCGITNARTNEGLLIAEVDTSAFLAEYYKIRDEARNKVEHGVMHTGLRADVPKKES